MVTFTPDSVELRLAVLLSLVRSPHSDRGVCDDDGDDDAWKSLWRFTNHTLCQHLCQGVTCVSRHTGACAD